MTNEIHTAASKGALGIIASTGGVIVSRLAAAQQWLQLLSLLIGCTVGVATLVSILLTIIKKWRSLNISNRASSSSSSSCVLSLLLLVMFGTSCSGLVPSEKQKSQSVAATESLATQQSMTIRRALETGPAVASSGWHAFPNGTVGAQIPTAPRNQNPGYGQSVEKGLRYRDGDQVTSTPIREQLEITTSTTTDAGSRNAASGSSMTSIPMGVKIALIGVGLIILVIGGKMLWSSIKTTAVGQGIAAGDNAIAGFIRAKRAASSHITDPAELAKINSDVAELEATRGRLATQVK